MFPVYFLKFYFNFYAAATSSIALYLIGFTDFFNNAILFLFSN